MLGKESLYSKASIKAKQRLQLRKTLKEKALCQEKKL